MVSRKKITLFKDEPLKLESGERLGPIDVVYETYGNISEYGDNVILVCHALTGSSHAFGDWDDELQHDGWWNEAIGPGKMLDTDEYFVVVPNVLGSCYGTTGPASVNPETGEPYRLSFPIITIGDMVEVQKAFVDALGIKKLLAVIGGSMGGMQVLEWAVRFPDRVKSAIPIATSARLSPLGIALDYIGRKAITLDPKWNGGNYESNLELEGLAIARMLGHTSYISSPLMWMKFGREHREPEKFYSLDGMFQVESYLDYQGHKFLKRFDANSYLYLTRAMDLFDLSRSYGSLEEAFQRVEADFLIISFTSDWLFTSAESEEIYKALLALGKKAEWHNIETINGHDSFLVRAGVEKMFPVVSRFLQKQKDAMRREL